MNVAALNLDSRTPPPNARAILHADNEAILRRLAIAGAPLGGKFIPAML